MQQTRTDLDGERSPSAHGETVLSVDGLHKEYGNGEETVTAVDDVSFDVHRGDVVGLLGANGAGKTTTIKSILSLVVPSVGTVEIAGIDATANPRTAYRHVGAMLEGARNVYWRLTVRENLQFFAALAGQRSDEAREQQARLLGQFGLEDKADDPVNELSRGQKQKVSLACTLARGTDLVFLDEPTLGLDVEASLSLRRELRRLATEESVTIVLSSHDMDVVEAVCDRVVILSEGRVIADEAVSDLVDLFETQSYRIEVDGAVTEDIRAVLTERYEATDWTEQHDRTSFDVTIAEGESLYDTLDVLRAADVSLADINSQDPDLEDVFLELTSPGEDST